ncbi:MAG: hypothetical protein IJA29_05635 [Lachnospiraceae bacterium]|nr:hypothetical protein [Lachnospiraceae bacterium]
MEVKVKVQESNKSESAEQAKKKQKKKKIIIGFSILASIVLFVVLPIIFIYSAYRKEYPRNKTKFASIEEFEECFGYVPEELPAGASDVRYYISSTPFTYKSIYSFVLADEEDFDAYMEAHKITQDTELLRDETYWEFYGQIISTYNASYTKEELVEMAYVEEHFEEMDYKEMLSMCDHQFGFYNGYGAKVSDFIGLNEPEYENSWTLEIPMQDSFDYVMDEELEDYITLYYDPVIYAISPGEGCFVNMETRRVVVFLYS